MFQKFLIKSNAKGIEKEIFIHDMKSEWNLNAIGSSMVYL